MRLEISAYWTQKLGNSSEEYEDAYWFSVNPERCTIAVSDGATEASFSQRWARILTRGFVEQVPSVWTSKNGKRSHNFSQWLRPLQKEWFAGIDFANLPWFAVEKAQKGAFASLLGLVINLEKGYWQALAIGDTNLFIIRGGELVTSWPLHKYEEFGSSPFLIGSNHGNNAKRARALQRTGGRGVFGGDVFVLATDAIAAYLLKNTMRVISEINSQATFLAFVEAERRVGLLKNDDTTLVIVRMEVS